MDGYAVRAADTYGASEGLPSYLDLAGGGADGRRATAVVSHGKCVAIPTGAALPDGADAVVMVEYTAETMPGTIEVTRPVAPGSGLVRADEDAAAGDVLVRAGRPMRAPQLGLLAAAGVTSIAVHARPRVAIVSTGDEVVPPETTALAAGQVRDATASALAGLIRDAGGEAVQVGIVPDDRATLQATLRAALAANDLVVVSAGSSVGARDETAGAVAALGRIWCHGLAVKPGKPTLLAECAGVPLLGLPGNPLSALVVFRLVGVPLVLALWPAANNPRRSRTCAPGSAATWPRRPAGWTSCRSPCATGWPSRCSDPPRCCRCRSGGRLPGRPGAGDGPRPRCRGGRHPVPMTSPFVSDIPAEQARRAWRDACAAAGCPPRVDAVLLPVGDAVGRVTAESVWARRSSPASDSAAMDGIAVRAAATVGAAETTPVLLDDFAVVDTGDPLPPGYDAVVMREHVHHTPDGRAGCAPPRRPTSTSVPSARISAPPSCSSPRAIGCAPSTWPPAPPPARPSCGAPEAPGGDHPDRRRDPPGRDDRRRGEILDTNSMMLAAQAAEHRLRDP